MCALMVAVRGRWMMRPSSPKHTPGLSSFSSRDSPDSSLAYTPMVPSYRKYSPLPFLSRSPSTNSVAWAGSVVHTKREERRDTLAAETPER